MKQILFSKLVIILTFISLFFQSRLPATNLFPSPMPFFSLLVLKMDLHKTNNNFQ